MTRALITINLEVLRILSHRCSTSTERVGRWLVAEWCPMPRTRLDTSTIALQQEMAYGLKDSHWYEHMRIQIIGTGCASRMTVSNRDTWILASTTLWLAVQCPLHKTAFLAYVTVYSEIATGMSTQYLASSWLSARRA